jgi:hypothetical protein
MKGKLKAYPFFLDYPNADFLLNVLEVLNTREKFSLEDFCQYSQTKNS